MSEGPGKNIQELKTAQNAPIENITLSGGGAKGAAYPGVIKALEEDLIIEKAKNISGSSAGAITAAFVAFGMTGEEYLDLMSSTNLAELSGSKTGLIESDAKPLFKMINGNINKKFADYTKDNNFTSKLDKAIESAKQKYDELSNLAKVTSEDLLKANRAQEELENLEDFQGNFNKDSKREKSITFQDLHCLRLIDPGKFKNLQVTATNQSTGKLEIFSYETTPSIDIAKACRASASLPGKFQPVEINGQKYVDGGYRDNLPQKYFPKNEKGEVGRTLAIGFGKLNQDTPVFKAVHTEEKEVYKPPLSEKLIRDKIAKKIGKIGGNIKYTDTKKQTFKEIHENALNYIAIDTGEITTLDFKDAQKKVKYLSVKGQLTTKRYLDNFELSQKSDPNLEHKEFILALYQKLSSPKFAVSKKASDMESYQAKIDSLLSLAEEKSWNDKTAIDIVENALKTIKDFDDKKLMNALVDSLNQSSTPQVVRASFGFVAGNPVVENAYKFTDKMFDEFEVKINNFKNLNKDQKEQNILMQQYINSVDKLLDGKEIKSLPKDIKNDLDEYINNVISEWQNPNKDFDSKLKNIKSSASDFENKISHHIAELHSKKNFTPKSITINTLKCLKNIDTCSVKAIGNIIKLDFKAGKKSLLEMHNNLESIGDKFIDKENTKIYAARLGEALKKYKEVHNKISNSRLVTPTSKLSNRRGGGGRG